MQDLPKAYNPLSVEKKCYLLWEKLKLFSADPKSKKEPFCIILPPPNVTGVLHMGHALVDTVQDILIRYKKMSGYEAFWVPGMDHAGISTQTVVERHLIATQGKRRVDYDRETFLKHVWDFKEATQEKILSQLKALGCALDWDRLRFTMDDQANLKDNRCTIHISFPDALLCSLSLLMLTVAWLLQERISVACLRVLSKFANGSSKFL